MTRSFYRNGPMANCVAAVTFSVSALAGDHTSRVDSGRAVAGPKGATLLYSPADPLVAFRVVLSVGSQNDPPGKEGLAALLASMVAEGGSKSLTYNQILAAFYPMAALVNGSCHKEMTVFAGVIHRDNLRTYFPIATGMIAQPRFDPADFDRLRNEAIDYVTKYLRGNNDEALGKWALQTELYRDHPYGHPDAGTVHGLRSITLDDLKEFHRRHYSQKSLSIGLAGGFDSKAPESIRSGFASLAAEGPTAPAPPTPRTIKGLDVTIVEKPAEATAISLGFSLNLTRSDDDFYALVLANSYLGEHRTFNGKLMQDLRGKRGLNYGDYSYIEDFIQEGGSIFPVPNNPRRQQYFSIWIRPVPADKAVFALRAALWELDRLVEHGMTHEQFEATRSFLLNYSKLWVQTQSRRLGYAIDGEFYDRRDLVSELAERLPKLRVEAVNSAVRKHLRTEGIKVAIVAKDAAALREALTSGKPSPITYDTQVTPDDILAEDKIIAAFPLEEVSVQIVPVEQMFEK
jgi:zinc protease